MDGENRRVSGFSLVDALIAAGVLSILALVVGEVVVSGNRGVADIRDRVGVLQFRALLTQVFSLSGSCSEVFKIQSNRTSVATLLDAAGTPKSSAQQVPVTLSLRWNSYFDLRTGAQIPGTQVKILRAQLKDIATAEAGSPPRYTAMIDVVADRSSLSFQIPLQFSVNTSQQVDQCAGGTSSAAALPTSSALCTALGPGWTWSVALSRCQPPPTTNIERIPMSCSDQSGSGGTCPTTQCKITCAPGYLLTEVQSTAPFVSYSIEYANGTQRVTFSRTSTGSSNTSNCNSGLAAGSAVCVRATAL